MTDTPFFDHPILNSPYEYPSRHWELDEHGQPTQQIIDTRRKAEFITPIPKPRRRKGVTAEQQKLIFDEGAGVSSAAQEYASTGHPADGCASGERIIGQTGGARAISRHVDHWVHIGGVWVPTDRIPDLRVEVLRLARGQEHDVLRHVGDPVPDPLQVVRREQVPRLRRAALLDGHVVDQPDGAAAA